MIGCKLQKCHDCGADPGNTHADGCDIERCSVCGGQRIMCGCDGHDKYFARWTGIWPGDAEAQALGIDLNTFHRQGLHKVFFAKPAIVGKKLQFGNDICPECGGQTIFLHHKDCTKYEAIF